MKQKIQLSDHFGYGKLIRFTLPSILMMICTSVYSVVDGFFVSNFVGKIPFAAVNLIMPYIMIVGAMGFMFGAGGSALIAKTLGEGNREKANNIFSLTVFSTVISGTVIGMISIAFLRPIAALLGAEGEILEISVLYGRIFLLSLPFLMLQYAFSTLVVTAEKPKFGLLISILSGIINIVCDALFLAVFHWGTAGAATASALAQVIGAIVPLVYFARENTCLLRLSVPHWDGKSLKRVCINGSSELMTNMSMSVVSMLYNFQLLRYAGENGIAAYGTIMYVAFIFQAISIGYSSGVAPVISFHYGAGNTDELKGLLKKSFVYITVSSVLMLVFSELMAYPLAKIYVGYDAVLMDMTRHAFTVYSVSFLFAGFSIFGSAFFTALNDGITSACISFLRTLLFQVVAVIVLPLILGLDGIWLSTVVAELVSIAVTLFFLVTKNRKYGYF